MSLNLIQVPKQNFLIPKLVHFTYKSLDQIPEKWSKTIGSWEKLGWKTMFHSDKDNDELVKEYPQLLSVYNSYKIPIQKVDAIRICYLHKWGGVYCDLDILAQDDIYEYLKNTDLALLRSPNATLSLTNMLMASIPNHSFWLEYINGLNNPYLPWFTKISKHFYVMYSTGPMLLNYVAKNTKLPYTLLPLNILSCNICQKTCNPTDPLILLEGQSWNGPDSYIINYIYCKWKFVLVLIILLLVIFLFIKYNKSENSKQNNNKINTD